MKTFILIIAFVFTSLFSFSQSYSYVKVADRPEYNNYLKYCHKFVPLKLLQAGKFRIVKQANGQYTDSIGHYVLKQPADTFWYVLDIPRYKYPPKIVTYNYDVDEMFIGLYVTVMVRQRKSSIRDFYQYWMTDSIKHN